MEIPVIDLNGLTGEESERMKIMAQLHEACKDWGFFWIRTIELVNKYIAQTVSLAEKLAECMSLNLGLASGYIKDTFAQPSVGTKFAMYPACPRPDLVWGLRSHTDAGGIIIMLLQDETVGGLDFLKLQADSNREEWVAVKPQGNRIFVDIGDQIEVISGGVYKRAVHRVAIGTEGRRLSNGHVLQPRRRRNHYNKKVL
ncbi:hypothetical protein PR202_ga16156 [Eleusine coracana subsp. coracana]|uniref:Fe2OG dioxygenase domain-containing protein n=1 Tax=Eleusine coracana subsp. coracana TaxID=191504 RepID=A0AAV5CLT5_ELECO|nr:hypothetical protein PR202_ga16156 [Eleusine coracana subsp. coracana]